MSSKGFAQSRVDSWSSDDSSRSVLYESSEGNVSKMPRVSQSSDHFNDVFSVMIRQRTTGVALYAVVIVSMLMAFVSFLLIYQYEPPLQQDETMSDYNLLSDVCTPQNHTSVWADLLTKQIEILQNLIHASLLGGSIIVAAHRGDVVWLFFARNCVFYFGLPAISYLVLDAVSRENSDRLVITAFFCLFCGIAFVKLEGICQSLRKLQTRLSELNLTPSSSLKESIDRDQRILPNYLAETTSDHAKAKIIFNSAVAVQVISVVYVVCTTTLALSPQCDESGIVSLEHRNAEGVVLHHGNTSDLSPFEMAYGLGAHESFLLSLFMLASTFPRCPASVGGAVLSSAWRLLIACCSLMHLLSAGYTNNSRTVLAVSFTTLEAISMIPILIAALQLSAGASTFRTILGCRTGHVSGDDKSAGSYSQVAANDWDDKETTDEDEIDCIDTDVLADTSSHRMSFPTLSLIAASSRFSPLQRFGASVLWFSSCCLFAGMATENMMLLITSPVGSLAAHDIYKWGMHVCAMYLFCVVMNVSSPEVYARARILLCFACPAGSIIGAWQLWILVSNTAHVTRDLPALMAGFLFLCRAMSGVGQFVGLFALDDIYPETGSLVQMDVTTKANAADEDTMLREAVVKGRFALFKLFLPTFVFYTATSALLGSCFEPMISPSTPCGGIKLFMLAPSWPGMGLFFHFGGLLVIFASDGLTTSTPSSYPPSVVVAGLFAFHTALLTAAHLTFELIHPDALEFFGYFVWQDWLRRVTLVGWMVTSFYLYLCLRRVWKLKQPIIF